MTAPAEPEAPQYDLGRVIDHLEQQLGKALGQSARLEAVVAKLLEERNAQARELDELRAKQ